MNNDLPKKILNAIRREPSFYGDEIGVAAYEEVVTLTGTVDNYANKSSAEEAAKYVAVVLAVVENIEVQFDTLYARTANEIAAEVVNAFKWHCDIPNEHIMIKVENGWVSLESEIEWNYQKEAVKSTVKNLIGVKGVSNNIMIIPKSKNAINVNGIESALWRHVTIDHNGIKVTVSGNKVTLTRNVESWYQKEAAARIVWNSPGVRNVDNQLTIQIPK